jgi:hypothetical protein
MAAPPPADLVPLQIGAHIRTRGDLSYTDAPWAGRIAPGLWIESFSVKPTGTLGADDVEYKGLTGSGFETPWLSGGASCGTKGLSVPLVGFAIRLKAGKESAAFDCEYSGYFKSGATVGPLRNGTPCRSTVANDPLEGIQLRIVRRTLAMQTPERARGAPAKPRAPAPAAAPRGPSFGRYRDAKAPAAHAAAVKSHTAGRTNGTAKAAVAAKAGAKPAAARAKPPVKRTRKSARPNPAAEAVSRRTAARR